MHCIALMVHSPALTGSASVMCIHTSPGTVRADVSDSRKGDCRQAHAAMLAQQGAPTAVKRSAKRMRTSVSCRGHVERTQIAWRRNQRHFRCRMYSQMYCVLPILTCKFGSASKFKFLCYRNLPGLNRMALCCRCASVSAKL